MKAFDFGIVLLFVSLFVVVVIIAVKVRMESVECQDIQTQSGFRTKWSNASGCYVEVNGRWIPRETWRHVE